MSLQSFDIMPPKSLLSVIIIITIIRPTLIPKRPEGEKLTVFTYIKVFNWHLEVLSPPLNPAFQEAECSWL